MTEIRESCGVFGVWGHPLAAQLNYLGLFALQHRGQESAGIAGTDGTSILGFKGMGLVSDVLTPRVLEDFPQDSVIGHVRYSTTGSSALENAQPLVARYGKGHIAVAHNGNLINSKELRDRLENMGSIFQSTSDSEVIIHIVAKPTDSPHREHFINSLQRIEGAFSLVLLTNEEMIGVRDPHGIRPLCLGKVDGAHVLASETSALDLVGATYIRDIEPGEVVFINDDGIDSRRLADPGPKAHCIFEHVYFSRPDSKVFGHSVHEVRKRLGAVLAQEHPVEADLVTPVPDSGTSAAIGYAHESDIPFDLGFIRNHYVGRTFISPVQGERALSVQKKINIVKDVVKGKRVVVVDDSVVRGTTSRSRVHLLREAGATEVHLRVSCPPIRFPCFYGIDFPDPNELIANQKTLDEIAEEIGVDSIGYLSLDGLLSCVEPDGGNFCTACYSGSYPLEVVAGLTKEVLEQ